ncbi:DinB family protein [soil metagenome]
MGSIISSLRPTLNAMDPLAHHLLTHAYNNAWANHRLLTACGQLTPADFEAARTSFFPSVKATLNHNLTVDWYYIDAIERTLAGRPTNPAYAAFFEPEEPFETCAALHAEQSVVDRRLIALCSALDAATLQRNIEVPRRHGIELEPVPRLLDHLFEHQIHHRGQVHAMLAGTSVSPPQLDEFFLRNEADLRADEFAALGFTEAMIWGGSAPAAE